MLVRRAIECGNRQFLASRQLHSTLNRSASTTSTFYNEEEPSKPPRKLKEWRKLPEAELSFLGMLDASSKRKKSPAYFPRKELRFAPTELKRWWGSKKTDYQKMDQRFIAKRHETLGCDLAAAHFLVHRDGKVKFHNQSDWICKDKEGFYELPSVFHASWQMSHLDATGIHLYYEGLENLLNLRKVEWASFKANRNLDDWCMDKISANFPNVEHLDVSECPKVTERGLEGFYKLEKLRKLIITDWNGEASFELTCSMLEDCVPGLSIEIQKPPINAKEKKVLEKIN